MKKGIFTKKIFALICCMMAMMCVFTGCNLFVENQERALNQVVASVGNVEVTLEELVKSYSTNAQTLTQNYGYTAEDAVEYCLDSLLARGVIYEIGKEMEEDDKIVITDQDKSDAVSNLVQYFGSLMDAYEEDALDDLDLESAKPSDEEETPENDYTKEEKFEKKYSYEVQVVIGENNQKSYKLVAKAIEEENENEFVVEYVNVFNNYLNGDNITDSLFKILDESYVASYGQELKDKIYENIVIAYKNSFNFYKNLSTKEIIIKEMTKILKDYEKQIYVDKVTEYYSKLSLQGLNSQAVIDSYLNKLNANKNNYQNNITAYVSKMLSSASDVIYHPIANEFAYVNHVLLKYSEEQEAEMKVKKQILSADEYELYVKKEADKILVNKYDEDGEVVKENVSPVAVLEEIHDAVKNARTVQERTRVFNEFVYSYNMDAGNKNAKQDYVVGREIKEDSDSRSKMVENFSKGARALLESYIYFKENPTASSLDYVTETEFEAIKDNDYVGLREEYEEILANSIFVGEVGSVTGLILTDYGYHIIMFTGIPTNLEFTNGKIESSKVKLEDVAKFNPSEWAKFSEKKTLRDLASVKLFNLLKEADKDATVSTQDIANGSVFTQTEINLMILDCVTISSHTEKTFLDESLENVAGSISSNQSNALYSNYVSSFSNTNQKLMKNPAVYEYLYK